VRTVRLGLKSTNGAGSTRGFLLENMEQEASKTTSSKEENRSARRKAFINRSLLSLAG
jgi:hypothetical protein